MKLFYGLKFFCILLMVAMVISFFGCGEDEEMALEPTNPVSTPVTVEQAAGDAPGSPVEIVWIEIDDDGNHNEKKEILSSSPPKEQVVIIVKVKDADGNPVPDVKVEWVLNQRPEAVGDIIDTDDPGDNNVPAAPNVKVDNTFAITYTNSEDGAPSQLEGMGLGGTDITIEKGETWIVITSVDEGDTDIMAFAPAIHRKNTHKIFAIKHWVPDAICLEPPKSEPTCIDYCSEAPGDANEETLVSTVVKCLDKSPVPNITVRYTIEDGGPDAVWDENDEKTIEVVSDTNGEVSATIKLVSPLPDPSKEFLQNIVTMEAFDAPEDEVPVDKEIITKEWCSAFLTISMPCPEGTFQPGDLAPFEITVTNDGECEAKDVEVTLDFSSEYFNPIDSILVGDLPPGVSSDPVNVTLTVKGETVIFPGSGDLAVTAKAGSKECVEAESLPCTFDVDSCNLKLDLVCPDGRIFNEGEEVPFGVTVTSNFEGLPEMATVTLDYPAEFFTPDPPYEIEVPLGESTTVKLTAKRKVEFIPGGDLSVIAKAKDKSGECKETDEFKCPFMPIIPPCNLSLISEDCNKPIILSPNEQSRITLVVKNNDNNNECQNYDLTVKLPDIVQLPDGTKIITWTAPPIPAGDSEEFTFEVNCIQEGEADIVATLSTPEVEPQTCNIPVTCTECPVEILHHKPLDEDTVGPNKRIIFEVRVKNKSKGTAEITLNYEVSAGVEIHTYNYFRGDAELAYTLIEERARRLIMKTEQTVTFLVVVSCDLAEGEDEKNCVTTASIEYKCDSKGPFTVKKDSKFVVKRQEPE